MITLSQKTTLFYFYRVTMPPRPAPPLSASNITQVSENEETQWVTQNDRKMLAPTNKTDGKGDAPAYMLTAIFSSTQEAQQSIRELLDSAIPITLLSSIPPINLPEVDENERELTFPEPKKKNRFSAWTVPLIVVLASALMSLLFDSVVPLLLSVLPLCVMGWRILNAAGTSGPHQLHGTQEPESSDSTVVQPPSEPSLPKRTFVKIQLDPSDAPVVIRRLKEKAKIRITVVHRGREGSSGR